MISEKEKEKLIEIRRDFHKYPETGWLEYRTTYKIAEHFKGLGYEVFIGKDVLKSESRMGIHDKDVYKKNEKRALEQGVDEAFLEKIKDGHTGLIAIWKSSKSGPVTALRFDIDALNIKETDSVEHIPNKYGFVSVNENTMHACGHDGHATIGIGLAREFTKCFDDMTGEIRLIFQPAEEGCRGAKAVVDKGWLSDVDYFLSGHIGFQSFELGEIVASTKNIFATTKVNVNLKGMPAHAGNQPEEGINALQAAANISLGLYSIPRHSKGMTRVNVGKLIAGQGRNIIPDKVYMEIETRGETSDLNNYMLNKTLNLVENLSKAYDVESTSSTVGEATGIEKVNPTFNKWIVDELSHLDYLKNVVAVRNLNASEDVTHMVNEVERQGGKASYMLYGSPLKANHHNDHFDFEEETIMYAVSTLKDLVLKLN